VGPLTDPTAHGGEAGDAFHLGYCRPCPVTASLASQPSLARSPPARHARGRNWCTASATPATSPRGGDVGALVRDLMGRQAVEGLAGYHLNLLPAVLAVGD
jgi:hypothetical protein